MSEVRIADELRLAAPIDVVWHAIEDPAAPAGAVWSCRPRARGRAG